MELGERADPAIAEPVAQVTLWQQLWREATANEREEATRVWHRQLPQIAKTEKGEAWQQTVGPLRVTMVVLHEQGWRPASPNHWIAPGGQQEGVIGESLATDAAIAAFIAETVASNVWEKAASHYHDLGLERGRPDLSPAIRARRLLRKLKKRLPYKRLCAEEWLAPTVFASHRFANFAALPKIALGIASTNAAR